MAAFTLQKAGHTVTIYDPQGFPAANASFKAGGMLAPFAEIEHMPDYFLEACFAGIDIWERLAETADFEFSRSGSLVVAHTQDKHMLERFSHHLDCHPRPVQGSSAQSVQQSCSPAGSPLISKTSLCRGDDIARLEPSLTGRFKDGIYLGGEAHLHPQKAMQFLIENITNKLHQKADMTGHDLMIDCTGIAYEDKDLRGVKGELLVVRNPDFSLSRPVRLMHPRYPLYIVPRADHHFMIGATNIEAQDDQNASVQSVMELMSALVTLHPSFAESSIVEIAADVRPSYPDNLPRIRQSGNIIACNGLYRHGYLLSPVMAQCVLALVEGRDYPYIPFFTGDNSDESHHQRHAQGLHSAA